MPGVGACLRGFLAAGLLCVGAIHTAPAGKLPYRLFVEVVWGEPHGPASARSELATALVTTLGAAGCFEAVTTTVPRQPDPADLRLRLVIHDYREEIDHEYRVADLAAPDLDTGRARIARVQADFVATIDRLIDDVQVRSRAFHRAGSWRPVGQEDARARAQRIWVDSTARTVRGHACKGSAKRWAREIEQAGNAPAR